MSQAVKHAHIRYVDTKTQLLGSSFEVTGSFSENGVVCGESMFLNK